MRKRKRELEEGVKPAVKQTKALLSFEDEEDEEPEEPKPKKKCFGRNPDVNTGFLKGSLAEEGLSLKKKLIEEYLEKQENLQMSCMFPLNS